MILISATVGPFRSINLSQTVAIDPRVTVFVGMNEAGKTVLLKALHKSSDALEREAFSATDDYPRKNLSAYLKKQKEKPEVAVELTYALEEQEIALLNTRLDVGIKPGQEITLSYQYDNSTLVTFSVDERPLVGRFAAELSAEAASRLEGCESLRDVPEKLADQTLTEADETRLQALKARIEATEWELVAAAEAWPILMPSVPKFLYFSDYDTLPGKMNLADLESRAAQATQDPQALKSGHRAVLALLRMADVSVADVQQPGGYEELKAKIEAVSISLTDQVLEFWKQNEDLEVEVDIKADPHDEAPFNNGANLYLRIKNRRHRGISTPFDQRSRGFIWFFSFLVWFDSVQHQIDASGKSVGKKLILLLDEPGLALHALAQADFLRYIDRLAEDHQVIYTTHSPFMVHSDRLAQVRLVEDRIGSGTVISDNLMGSDPRTIFPLQAALGWTIAQNLFISKRNLLVEGPSELIYLQVVSSILEANGGVGIRGDITIVPTGGLDNLATFVSLLGASGLKIAVLHDYRGAPEQRMASLVREKIIAPKFLFNVSQFRDLERIGENTAASDIEDLFSPSLYLKYFNETFAKQLNGVVIAEDDLLPGDRIVVRLERYVKKQGISLRGSDGYNHYAVANKFASAPPVTLDDDTFKRFEALFAAINAVF